MRRGPALACVAIVLVVALVFAFQTWRCGVRSVSEGCVSPEDCDAGSVCVSALHPFAPALAAIAVLAGVLAWRRQGFALMLTGTILAGVGALFIFSAGVVGAGSGVLVALAGSFLSDLRWTRIAAPVAAALAPVAGLVAASAAGILAFYGGVALPAVAWSGLAAWEAVRRQSVAPSA